MYLLGSVQVANSGAAPALLDDFSTLRTNAALAAEATGWRTAQPPAGQDAGLRCLHAAALRRHRADGRGLRVPDASGSHEPRARHLSEVRHEGSSERVRRHHTAITTPRPRYAPRRRGGLEWEDLMPEINAQTGASNMLWKLVDEATGAKARQSTGRSRLATASRSGSSTRWTATIRCIIRSTCTAPVASWSWPMAANPTTTSSGRTRSSSAPAKRVDILLELTEPGWWMAPPHRRAQPGRDDVQLHRVSPA